MIRRQTALLLGLSLLAPPTAVVAQQAPTRVFVVATLYRRHAETPAYSHDTLRTIIRRIAPTAVVLDVSPRELREQRVHPSKAEYPEVIFPMVREAGWRAYAGEPDEPEFSRIVEELRAAHAAFRTDNAEAAAADSEFERATFAALARLWRTPADVNGGVTERLLSARRALQDALAGPQVASAWSRWNARAVEVVLEAVRANPGGKVLVLIGVENTALLRPALRDQPGLTLVDVERWLRQGGPG